MKVCAKCRKEMCCEENGVACHFGHGHVYRGDLFQCKECGASIVVTSSSPTYEPNVAETARMVIEVKHPALA